MSAYWPHDVVGEIMSAVMIAIAEVVLMLNMVLPSLLELVAKPNTQGRPDARLRGNARCVWIQVSLMLRVSG